MSNSKLATEKYPAYSGNYTKGRSKKITEICIHHMAGVLTAKQCGGIFQKVGRKGSSNYGIGKNGEIAVYVDEKDTAWCNSNWNSNCRSVSIETSNSKNGGNWPVSDKVLESLIELVADIAKRNNMGKLVKGKNVTWHSMYHNTQCIPTNTELLTKNGWKKLKDIQIGDEVASADLDNLNITFEEVYDKVPIKKQDTYTNNELTATKDHRMVYSIQSSKECYKIEQFGKLLKDNNNYYIPLAGTNKFDGLKLSDDMIKFYIAVQADGHYIKEKDSYYGLEFHLKKERKINTIKEILSNINLPYTVSNKSDGSVSIRVWNFENINIVNDICEKYLCNKCFTWEWLYLNSEQASLFLNEILFWDGCQVANKYTSAKQINLDIVNAIASINKVGSRIIGNNVYFRETPYITLTKEQKRNQVGELTEVSCVSVKTGLILIRQNGKTFIVGNCPGPYLLSKMDYIVNKANEINQGKGELKITEIEKKKVVLNTDANLWDLTFESYSDAKYVKEYDQGDIIDNIVAIAEHPLGSKYYMTEYSYKNNIKNGFNVVDCDDYIENAQKNEDTVQNEVPKVEESPIIDKNEDSDGKDINVGTKEETDINVGEYEDNKEQNSPLLYIIDLIINFIKKIFGGK